MGPLAGPWEYNIYIVIIKHSEDHKLFAKDNE